MTKSILSILLLLLLISCQEDPNDTPLSEPVNPKLQYFGYTLVDVYWDDPTDDDGKLNYIDEVADFSNIADLLVVEPTQNIEENLQTMNSFNVKAVIHLNEIFFEITGSSGEKSGVQYDLRTDYKERWDTFINTNKIDENKELIEAFYIGEEPTWNDISFEELEAACDYAKATIPDVKVFVVEAFPVLEELEIPASVDWAGFDHYFIADPVNNQQYRSELDLLKSKMTSNQELILILDAHFIDFAHGSSGIAKSDLDFVARSYYELANEEESVVGILGYHWPSGFEFENAIGARGLPENVINEHKRIGKAITGK